jgi:ABC-type transporter Mla maintaining outer membrane lipid asymmetry ATPase subunit MlaF
MNAMAAKSKTASPVPVLQVTDLQVHFGLAHVLQGISLTLDRGVLGVIGRNGMGKTTLCQTILGLKPATSGCPPTRFPISASLTCRKGGALGRA